MIVWGKQAYHSDVVDLTSPRGDIRCRIKVPQKHTNYYSSMTTEVPVIVDINVDTPIMSKSDVTNEVCRITLCQVLYQFFKMSDGHSLFTEIYQRGNIGAVGVVIPNMPDAETILAMINKHFVGYFVSYLKDKGVNAQFVQ